MAPLAAEKRKTRAELEASISELQGDLQRYREVNAHQGGNLRAAADREKEAAVKISDLKGRLAIAESENQRMRGYIARVQEDDVVREDLLKVGDPEGEHQLVPKRKPTAFHTPSPYDDHAAAGYTDMHDALRIGRDRKPPKHWVTY